MGYKFFEKKHEFVNKVWYNHYCIAFDSSVNGKQHEVRVNNFREKSSAGIDGLKLGAGFEQDC